MRLSTNESDSGYRDWCILNGDGKVAKVLLDGVEQKRVLMADDEAGEIERQVETPQGRIALDKNTGEFLTEIVKGKVKIQIVSE